MKIFKSLTLVAVLALLSLTAIPEGKLPDSIVTNKAYASCYHDCIYTGCGLGDRTPCTLLGCEDGSKLYVIKDSQLSNINELLFYSPRSTSTTIGAAQSGLSFTAMANLSL